MTTLPEWARRGRLGWTNTGRRRPSFAREPGPNEESVWDYPRPPALVSDPRRVLVRLGEVVVVDTERALRLLETSHPPTFYLPPQDVNFDLVVASPGAGVSRCEWKGSARYWDVVVGGRRLARVGWSYPEPFADYAALRGHLAFYASELECFVGGERVRPQPGGFYGGWVTSELAGPFKGEPGTSGW